MRVATRPALFDDPLPRPLAGEEGFRWMEEMSLPSTPAENPTIGSRTRCFDDLVVAATGAGIRPGGSRSAGTATSDQAVRNER